MKRKVDKSLAFKKNHLTQIHNVPASYPKSIISFDSGKNNLRL